MTALDYANGGPCVPRTPQFNHKPYDMKRRSTPEAFAKIGDFAWTFEGGDLRVLAIAIPRIGHRGWIYSEWVIGAKNESGIVWSWDGNEDMPTITPSLHAKGIWHGCVKEGKLVEIVRDKAS